MRSYIFANGDRSDWVAFTVDGEHVWYDSAASRHDPYCVDRETADAIILSLLERGYERVP